MIERWWIDPGAAAMLGERGLTTLDGCAAAAARGRVLSRDRQSAAVLLEGSPPLLLKWRHTLPGRRGRTWLRRSRERREAVAARKAGRLGIPCPRALAVAERRAAGLLVASALIRPFLPDHSPAGERWSPATCDRVAVALRSWHDAGFRHGDAYPKNILLPAGDGPCVPIGCPAARFRSPGSHLDRARLRDLARICVGIVERGADPAAFLEAYGRSMGLRQLERCIAPHRASIEERKRRRIASRPQREPEGPQPPVPIPPAPGIRRVIAGSIEEA